MAISASRRRRSGYPGPACPWCSRAIPHATFRTGLMSCPSCARPFEAVRFDPLEPRVPAVDLAAAGPGEDVPCAKHARNRAAASCQRCGQFMCALCRIDADGKAYCPSCFERLSAEGAIASAVTRVKNYAGMASSLIACGYLFCFIAGLPMGLGAAYYSIRGLRDLRARGEEGRGWMIVRLVLSILLMGLGTLVLVALFGGFR